MKTFLYKAKNCTDLADCDYAIEELSKMIRAAEINKKPIRRLQMMLANVCNKKNKLLSL